MWQIGRVSIGLFLRGKLFASTGHAIGLAVFGLGFTALLLVIVVTLGLPVLVATPIAGFAGGMLQPGLYQGLRYR
jgi:hypothetical protein